MSGAPDSVLARTAKGAGWVIGWRMATRALGLLSTLFLVRLLLPADFGLVTLATGFSQAIDSLSSLGVEEAVIREEHPTPDLYDSAFTINVIRGAATAAVVAGAAWPVARFFGDARLFPVILALAAGALVAAFENIGIVDFRRDLTFEKEFVLMLLPRLASIVVAIGLAWAFQSHWALVSAILASIVLRTVLGYRMHPYRPRLRLPAWRQIAGFSFWSWLLSLSSLMRDRCDGFVIGRIFGSAQVGVFAVGAEIAALPTTELISPLSRACFSGFAATRGDRAGTAQSFLRVIGSTALLAVPAGVGLSLVADPVVRLAFGAAWSGAATVIQVLGVALTLMVGGMIGSALLNAHALLRPLFGIQALAVVVKLALLIVLTMAYGLLGAALAIALATALEQGLILALTLQYLGLGGTDVLRVTWPSLLGTLAMAAGMAAFGLGWTVVDRTGPALAATLLTAVLTGAAIYGAAIGACWAARGRPDGPEQDLLGALGRAWANAVARLRRGKPMNPF